jgi:2-alkyl-3-oxoalkanoate reductase
MKAAAERDRKVRVEGNINLLATLRDAGVRRYFCKVPDSGMRPARGWRTSPSVHLQRVPGSRGQRPHLQGIGSACIGVAGNRVRRATVRILLRPRHLVHARGRQGEQVRQQQVPIIGEGQGVYSFVHIDDAAGATAAALECPPGAYNIVDGNPSPQHVWLTGFARAAGAPAPPRVSEEEALRASGPDAVYYATRLRGASHEKARRKLEFRPRPLEWI